MVIYQEQEEKGNIAEEEGSLGVGDNGLTPPNESIPDVNSMSEH